MEFKKSLRRFLFSRPAIVGLVAVICLITGMVAYSFMSNSAAAHEPEYATVLPTGKKISELGGWKRISPPEKEPVFAFADKIDGITISVSEQSLPPSFKSDLNNQVAQIAQKFNATDKIDAGDFTIYVGTSSKGPQSAIFAKNDLLILIKSEKEIKNTSWAAYAKSLH